MPRNRRYQRRIPVKRPTPPSPTPAPPTDAITRINDLTRVGKANWFGLLAYLVFAFVTLLGVQNADFFVSARETTLPLIGVDIPTFSFFAFAPALGAALYVYLHLHIRKVIEELTRATPATTGVKLEERITPWLLNDAILLARAKSRNDPLITQRRMDWLVTTTTVTLIWLAGPFVQLAFWWRSVPANAEWMTMFLGLMFWITCYAGLESWSFLRHSLGRSTRWLQPSRWRATLSISTIIVLSWISTEGGIARYTDKVIPRLFSPRISELNPALRRALTIASDDFVFTDLAKPRLFYSAEPNVGDRIAHLFPVLTGSRLDAPPRKFWPISVAANLKGEAFVTIPQGAEPRSIAKNRFRQDFCNRRGLSISVCSEILGESPRLNEIIKKEQTDFCDQRKVKTQCDKVFQEIDQSFESEWVAARSSIIDKYSKDSLSGFDLRKANLEEANLQGVNLTGALLDHANLAGASLERADFTGASLQHTIFDEADLYRSTLASTNFSNATFVEATVQSADLSSSTGFGADFSGALMIRTDLRQTNLEQAVFFRTDLFGAKFTKRSGGVVLVPAKLKWADLQRAKMNGVDLREADVSFANLAETHLNYAILELANLERSYLTKTELKNANLHGASFLGAEIIGAELGGSDISYTSFSASYLRGLAMPSTSMTGVSFEHSLLYDVVFPMLQDITEKEFQLSVNSSLGNQWTKLPTASPPIAIRTCWKDRPPDWEKLLGAIYGFDVSETNRKYAERALICAPYVNSMTWFVGPTRDLVQQP